MPHIERRRTVATRRVARVVCGSVVVQRLGVGIADQEGDIASATLYLGEPLVDLYREVVVRSGDKELFRGKLERRFRFLIGDLENDGWDATRAAPTQLTVKF